MFLLFEGAYRTAQANSLQELCGFCSPVSGEGGKLAAIFADLQRLGAGLGLGQSKQVSVQLHGEGHLVLGECVVRARPIFYHT